MRSGRGNSERDLKQLLVSAVHCQRALLVCIYMTNARVRAVFRMYSAQQQYTNALYQQQQSHCFVLSFRMLQQRATRTLDKGGRGSRAARACDVFLRSKGRVTYALLHFSLGHSHYLHRWRIVSCWKASNCTRRVAL